MTVRKFSAKTSREALKQIRDQLGPDAVILSNRQIANGVELLALDERQLTGLVEPTAPQKPVSPAKAAFENLTKLKKPVPPVVDTPVERAPGRNTGALGASARESAAVDPTVLDEIKSMRGMLEQQLAQLAWDETARRRPLRIRTLQRLLSAGFSPALARQITERLPDDFSVAQAETWLHAILTQNLTCAGAEQSLVDRGGVYALVGPTGVGKTTTTAKLAARCVVKYGAQKLGLITTDSYRIGAQDQLRIYGKILGVSVSTVQDEGSLQTTLAGMRDKHLVLIDTVGMAQRDARVAEQLTMFANLPVRRLLLLNASCQLETLEDVFTAYRGNGLMGCVLTKVDEAVKIGGALDLSIRARLPLQFITNGQRVPEDLHAPNAALLVHRALKAPTPVSLALNEDEFKLLAANVPASGAAARRAVDHD